MLNLNLMIDIETHSTASNAIIVSIGAVMFDIFTGKLGSEFYVNIDPQSCKDRGMHERPETLKWWAKQSKEAQEVLLVDQIDITDALQMFTEWLITYVPKGTYLWANGSSFDPVILTNAYEAVNRKFPVEFWDYRDYKTFMTTTKLIKNVFGSKEKLRVLKRKGTYHNALDDTKHQALTMCEVYRGVREDARNRK